MFGHQHPIDLQGVMPAKPEVGPLARDGRPRQLPQPGIRHSLPLAGAEPLRDLCGGDVGPRLKSHNFSPLEMSLRASGHDAPCRGAHLARNGITAKTLGEGEGVKGRSRRLPVCAAQPLRPSFSPSIITRPCESAEPLHFVSRGRSRAAARSRPVYRDQHRRWPEAPRRSRCLEACRARLRARRHRRPEVRPVQ
jgi:hypothetical protein